MVHLMYTMYFHYIWNMFHVLPCRWNREMFVLILYGTFYARLVWYIRGCFVFSVFWVCLFLYNIRCIKCENTKYTILNNDRIMISCILSYLGMIQDHFIMGRRFAGRCMSGSFILKYIAIEISSTIAVTLWIS